VVVAVGVCRWHHRRALLLAMMRIDERWPVPRWVVRTGLVGAAIGLAAVIWRSWSVTSLARGGLCEVVNGAPFTTFPYPSQAFVLTAIAAYVVGHISSRYVVEVRPELVANLGEDKFDRIGPVLVAKSIATGFLLIATILNLYEARAFAIGNWPITYYVWCATAASPILALLATALVSFLIGRWLWIPR